MKGEVSKGWIELGGKIKALRKPKGWTQELLAHEIGCTPRTISRWETGKSPVDPSMVSVLKRVLGLDEDDFISAYGERLPTSRNEYRMCSFGEAAGICGSFKALDDAFAEIEDEVPVPTEEGEYGESDKWVKLLKATPETGGCLLYKNCQIVGYWQCFIVNDNLYNKILLGENVNSQITTDDIIVISDKGKDFNLFFISLFVKFEHRDPIRNGMIFDHFLTFLLNSAKSGVFFKRIAANITGLDARALCAHRGFRKVIDHPIHKYCIEDGGAPAEIFELVVQQHPSRIFTSPSKLHRELKRRYSEAGIAPA